MILRSNMDFFTKNVLCKVEINSKTMCWEHQNAPIYDGYCRVQTGSRKLGTRKKKLVHRLSYEHFTGSIPAGKLVMHRCDNRTCCNPSHLFIGTDQDNATDSKLKGRKRKKLSGGQVREMRLLRQEGYLLRELSKEFGVSQEMVSRICRKKAWTYIE